MENQNDLFAKINLEHFFLIVNPCETKNQWRPSKMQQQFSQLNAVLSFKYMH